MAERSTLNTRLYIDGEHFAATVQPGNRRVSLARKLREAGVPVQDLYFSRPGHATLVATLSRPMRGLAPVLEQIAAFVKATPGQ